MSGKLVTVVIPAYNAARYLTDALDSALKQTYAAVEVVVIDDGSTDETPRLLSTVSDPRVRVVRTTNQGVGAARNLGWRLGRGDFVAFLDADDRWFPPKLATQVEFLREHPEVGLVGCLMRYQTPAGELLGVTGVAPLSSRDREAIRQAKLMPFPISSVVVRRSVLEDLGGFDEQLPRAFPGQVEDIDLVARAARKVVVDSIPLVLGAYRVHAFSASERHFTSQRVGVRFVRARLRERDAGRDLEVAAFLASYRPTLAQRWGDATARLYRRAGLAVAERRWLAAVGYGLASAFLGPRYTIRRLGRQRPWKRAPEIG
jgi:glycosyltransferase involved in cell wall biosynthesis